MTRPGSLATAPRRSIPATRFEVPAGSDATRPPEWRGLARDDVRLLVVDPDGVRDLAFRQLPDVLAPGDLVVVNTSATVPAALEARRGDGRPVTVHVATPLAEDEVVVEVRRADATGPVLDGHAGEVLVTGTGLPITLLRPTAPPASRLWHAWIGTDEPLADVLAMHGRPITYAYLDGRFPLSAYQTVFGREPGSAEMASAGRPFRDATVTELVTHGIAVAPVVLHTGVSSLEADEAPQPEWFRVPATTARLVRHTRRHGGRVVAVGTTVTRALETVARPDGTVVAGDGWTELVLGPDRPARVVDGLVTGWHAPDASHLLLLEAVAGPDLVQAAYDAATTRNVLWHEFGDSCLLLPPVRSRR